MKSNLVGKKVECEKAERDIPQVQRVMKQLERTTETLEEATSRLEERIRSILAFSLPAGQPGQAVKGNPDQSIVPLAASLGELRERLEGVAERLSNIVDRVEI